MPNMLVETLTGKPGPSLRAEMMVLIADHLKAVLDRKLDDLIRKALQTSRDGRS